MTPATLDELARLRAANAALRYFGAVQAVLNATSLMRAVGLTWASAPSATPEDTARNCDAAPLPALPDWVMPWHREFLDAYLAIALAEPKSLNPGR